MQRSVKTADHLENIFTTLSNVAFLFPLWLLLSHGRFVLAGFVAWVFLFSMLYHWYKTPGADLPWEHHRRTPLHRVLLWTDILSSISLGLYVFVTQFLPSVPRTESLRHETALILFILAIFSYAFPSDRYELKHSMWHVFAAGALFCLYL